MIANYYYNAQLKTYIRQFANIFTGLQVYTGKGADGEVSEIDVPIVYASKDRAVASIGASNTQNRLHTLPIMSCYMTGVELNPAGRHGVNQASRTTYLPPGGIFPDDLTVSYKVMPVPYILNFDLCIYTSNTDQAFQILEQLMIVFDPTLQLQTSTGVDDWTKLTNVELLGLNNEENMPSSTEKRMIIWTLNFKVDAYLSPPIELKNNIVQRIRMQFGNLDKFHLYEYDDAGEPAVFEDGADGLWTESTVEDPTVTLDPP